MLKNLPLPSPAMLCRLLAATWPRIGRRRAPGALASRLLDWAERSRSRRALAALSDHQLRDIGLTHVDVWGECRKPFWEP
jgi:uncharacterized protein YjiS (DUF1127 family)